MTAGQHGGRDYGHDYQTYPPYNSIDPDEHVDWGAGYREAGRRQPDGRDYPQSPYPGPPSYGETSYPTPSYSSQSYPAPPSYPGHRRAADDYPNRWPGSATVPPAGTGAPEAPALGQAPGYESRGLGQARHRTAARVRGERDRRGGPADRNDRSRAGRKRRGLPLWQELPLLLIIAFCLAILVRSFLLQAFYIPSGSMEDTLIAGDRVLVNKVVYQFREPARGEVVVFRGTDAWAPELTEEGDIGAFARIGRALGGLVGVSRPGEKDFIKRVIGLPGDTVSCCDVDGRVFVNGQPLDESYVIRDSPLDEESSGGSDCRNRRFDEVVVQPGHMFVMGDHRQVSQDSRCQGQVPIENIIGRAFIIVWPSGRWDSLSQPDTFDNVPAPVTAAGPLVAPATGGPDGLAFVLPLLLPLGWFARRRGRRRWQGFGYPGRSSRVQFQGSRWSNSARSGLIGRTGRRSVCRLAE